MSEHEFTDKTLAQDLDRLKQSEIDTNELSNILPRQPIVAEVGSGTAEDVDQTGGGGGIESPLTEKSRTTTTKKIFDPQDNTSYIEVESIVTLTMEDAAGIEIVFNFTPQP